MMTVLSAIAATNRSSFGQHFQVEDFSTASAYARIEKNLDPIAAYAVRSCRKNIVSIIGGIVFVTSIVRNNSVQAVEELSAEQHRPVTQYFQACMPPASVAIIVRYFS